MRAAFLEAYRLTTATGALYRSFEEHAGLLELFELEKALYELRYELDNRPDWVRVPLRGHPGPDRPPVAVARNFRPQRRAA